MALAKIGRRGQLTLPAEVRRALDIGEGDSIAFAVSGQSVTVLPVKRTLLDLCGSVHVTGPQDFDAVRKQVMATRAEERARHDP